MALLAGTGALPLPWPFDRAYMQLALAAGVAVGCTAPLVGAYLVQRRMSLMGDGLGHLAFAGVALGLLTGSSPIWTALVVAVVGALVVERVRSRSRSSGDLALALVFYAGIAGGSVLLGLADSLDANVVSYLFGSIGSVADSDVWTVVGVAVAVLCAITVLGRALFAVVIDEDAARVSGLPVARLDDVFAVITAVTVVVSMRVVGILLVSALMVLPVGSAQLLTRSFRGMLRTASAIGVACVVVGLGLSRAIGLAPGGTIVLLAAVLYAGCALVQPRRLRRRGIPTVPGGSSPLVHPHDRPGVVPHGHHHDGHAH